MYLKTTIVHALLERHGRIEQKQNFGAMVAFFLSSKCPKYDGDGIATNPVLKARRPHSFEVTSYRPGSTFCDQVPLLQNSLLALIRLYGEGFPVFQPHSLFTPVWIHPVRAAEPGHEVLGQGILADITLELDNSFEVLGWVIPTQWVFFVGHSWKVILALEI